MPRKIRYFVLVSAFVLLSAGLAGKSFLPPLHRILDDHNRFKIIESANKSSFRPIINR